MISNNDDQLVQDKLFIQQYMGATEHKKEVTEVEQVLKDVSKDTNKHNLENSGNRNVKNNCGDNDFDVTNNIKPEQNIMSVYNAHSEKKMTLFDNTNKTTKRDGTSGVSGQLYETKLLSLVFFRASTNNEIGQFCLAANMNDIGDLDDLCIRYKQKDENIMIFLQAKHRSDAEKGGITKTDLYKEKSDFCLPKYFKSYLDIRQKFSAKNKDDIMFQAQYEDIKCYFILYTTANDDIMNEEKRVYSETNVEETAPNIKNDFINTTARNQFMDGTVKNLISTGENSHIFRYKYDAKDIDQLSKTVLVNRLKQMGIKFFEIISEDNENTDTKKTKRYENMMTDKDIRNFHIVLAQKVINVSKEVNDGHRVGKFREEFFSSNDELLIELRKAIYCEALKKRKLERNEIDSLFLHIVRDPCPETIGRLIGTVITYNTDIHRLEITDRTIRGDPMLKKHLPLLQKLHVTQEDAKNAFEMAGENELGFEFKLPASFGNSDLKLPQNKVEKKLENRTKTILDMISNSTDKNIIVDQKAGIEDAVGNLLVYDEDSKSLMFNMDDKSLGNYAKKMLENLKNKIHDLHTYRLSVNVFGFPRVSFDTSEYERSFAKDFLNNLWFYTCQAKEDEIEKITKKEISDHYNARIQNQALFRVKAEAIFLKFHDEIQKWWMLESSQAYYLTNNDVQIFDNILNYFVDSPLLSVLNFIFINRIKNIGIEFNDDAIEHLFLGDGSTGPKIIETDVNILSSMKLVQHFKEHSNCKFLDLDYLLSLPQNNVDIAINEISNINVDVLVILYDNTTNDENLNKLEHIIQESDERKVLVVTRKDIAIKLKNSLPTYRFSLVRDEKNNITDLTFAAQLSILNANITFQWEKITFGDVIESALSRQLINGEILSKIINKAHIKIGRGLLNAEYNEIKEFYVNRTLKSIKDTISVDCVPCEIDEALPGPSTSTSFPSLRKKKRSDSYISDGKKTIFKSLKDIDDVAVIVAEAGMGKSTLLTHLSIETKKMNPSIWIERINLNDHKKQFEQWRQDNVKVDMKETCRFLCKTALTINASTYDFITNNHKMEFDVDYINNELVLRNANINVINSFELNLFIHSCNTGNVVFLFDGFDVVYPKYTHDVVNMLIHVREMVGPYVWITTRPSDGISDVLGYIADTVEDLLRNEFDNIYILEPCTKDQEIFYYESFFEQNLKLSELNAEQFRNVDSLFEHVEHYNEGDYMNLGSWNQGLHTIHVAAIEYFKTEIRLTPLTPDKVHYRRKWNTVTVALKDLAKSGTPQHMHLLANYFQRTIKNTQSAKDTSKWNMGSLPILGMDIAEAKKSNNSRLPDKSEDTEMVKQVQELKIFNFASNKTVICDGSRENSSA